MPSGHCSSSVFCSRTICKPYHQTHSRCLFPNRTRCQGFDIIENSHGSSSTIDIFDGRSFSKIAFVTYSNRHIPFLIQINHVALAIAYTYLYCTSLQIPENWTRAHGHFVNVERLILKLPPIPYTCHQFKKLDSHTAPRITYTTCITQMVVRSPSFYRDFERIEM